MGRDVILYVEDDDAYAQIMDCVLKQTGFDYRMIHLTSGAQAKAYITGVGEFTDRSLFPSPSIILADLKMPAMTGLELLEWVRSQTAHRLTPFIILTSSDDLKEITKAYQLGANSFLTKPPTVADLVLLLKSVLGKPTKNQPDWPGV